tara:strand:- start:46687 stop:47706 length:1020 start_codon:yes stop_codon:yes gene_type:complete
VLKLINTSTQLVPINLFLGRSAWIPSADAMFVFTTTNAGTIGEVIRAYRDGSWVSMGKLWFNVGAVNFMDAPQDGELLIFATNAVYPLDPITWTANLQKPFTTAVPTSRMSRGLYLRNRAGVLKFYDAVGKGYTTFDNATGADEGFTAVYPSGLNIDLPLKWVRDQVIAVCRGSDIILWDLDTQTAVLTSTFEAAHTVQIDTNYQNLITLRASDGALQVWDLEIEPSTLTSFTATPGLYDRYHTEALSVTLLGDDGEPVAGVEVEWKVETVGAESGAVNAEEVNALSINEGASVLPAKGKITPNVSITNALGVATATYCPPGLDWLSGDQELITTTVRT